MRKSISKYLLLAWVCISLQNPYLYGQHELSDSNHIHAEKAFKIQDYSTSFKMYTECFTKDSLQLLCFQQAGVSAYRLGNFKNAKDIYSTIEQKSPENHLILSQLASIYEQEENIPKAIKYYIKLSELFSENPVYLRKLAQLYNKADEIKEAFNYYSKSYKINPNDVFTVKGLVNILLINQQFGLADSILQTALIVDKSNVSIRLLSALSNYKQKEYNQTVQELEQIISVVDLNNYYNKLLGYSYMQIDSVDQAIYYLQKSLVGEGNPEHAHYYLGTAYEQKRDFPSAIYHFKQAVKSGISEDLDLYYRGLARVNNTENDLKNAIINYQEAYKYSRDPLLLFYLGRASDSYYKDKNIAVRYYSQYVKSSHFNEEYKSYARQRNRLLKEQIHFNN